MDRIKEIIDRYYPEDNKLKRLLLIHSRKVADKALQIARKLIESHHLSESIGDIIIPKIDLNFIEEAAMLHDIGIFRCNAPDIYCYGELPYICHGVEGGKILREEGMPRHALVCERHTGSGLTRAEIVSQGLPLPAVDMLPVSMEEKIICYADKFYSKSGNPDEEKSIEGVRACMARHGDEALRRFDELRELVEPF